MFVETLLVVLYHSASFSSKQFEELLLIPLELHEADFNACMHACHIARVLEDNCST